MCLSFCFCTCMPVNSIGIFAACFCGSLMECVHGFCLLHSNYMHFDIFPFYGNLHLGVYSSEVIPQLFYHLNKKYLNSALVFTT